MHLPETRFARSGDIAIAFQVLGGGLVDLMGVPPFGSNVELMWEPWFGRVQRPRPLRGDTGGRAVRVAALRRRS